MEIAGSLSILLTGTNQAVQAMTTIGLIGLIGALICAALYVFVHNFSKNAVLIMLCVFSFISGKVNKKAVTNCFFWGGGGVV